MILGLMLAANSWAGKIVVTNNLRVMYDFGHEIKPYVANEIKLITDDGNTIFDANKLRLGFRYKTNEYVRLDPHWFIDNKRKNDWVFEHGTALRLDITF